MKKADEDCAFGKRKKKIGGREESLKICLSYDVWLGIIMEDINTS